MGVPHHEFLRIYIIRRFTIAFPSVSPCIVAVARRLPQQTSRDHRFHIAPKTNLLDRFLNGIKMRRMEGFSA